MLCCHSSTRCSEQRTSVTCKYCKIEVLICTIPITNVSQMVLMQICKKIREICSLRIAAGAKALANGPKAVRMRLGGQVSMPNQDPHMTYHLLDNFTLNYRGQELIVQNYHLEYRGVGRCYRGTKGERSSHASNKADVLVCYANPLHWHDTCGIHACPL